MSSFGWERFSFTSRRSGQQLGRPVDPCQIVVGDTQMARITLFRHAKAETPTRAMSDFDRALANRGRRNADRMGRFIARHDLLPDLVIVSPAARTRQTHELAAVHWPDIPVIYRDSIYEASATTILTAIQSLGADRERVMVIGHNPGLAVLLGQLVETPPPDADLFYFPTSCVADIGFDATTIGGIAEESGRLMSLVRVRELGEVDPL